MDTTGSPNIIAKVAINGATAEAWVLRLEEEARLYCNELRHLQGRVIPRFFGFYTGTRKRAWPRRDVAPAAWMILEDCGNSLMGETGTCLEDLPRPLKRVSTPYIFVSGVWRMHNV